MSQSIPAVQSLPRAVPTRSWRAMMRWLGARLPRRRHRPEPLPAALLRDIGLHAEYQGTPLPLHHTDPLLLRR